MICYASRTGTKRNLATLRAHGWGLLVSRAGVWRTEGFDRICADNGAWADFKAGRAFDEDAYERFLDWLAAQPVIPEWLVLPDIVAGGLRSLALSMRYINRCRAVAPLVLIAVQDGMEPNHLAPLVGPQVGIFLGGSTKWKLMRMAEWGEFCAERGIHYHVARVNSAKRMFLAIAAGATSIDGSSGSRYAVSVPVLTSASQHLDLFAPLVGSRLSGRAHHHVADQHDAAVAALMMIRDLGWTATGMGYVNRALDRIAELAKPVPPQEKPE